MFYKYRLKEKVRLTKINRLNNSLSDKALIIFLLVSFQKTNCVCRSLVDYLNQTTISKTLCSDTDCRSSNCKSEE